jgi:hypothetical protein
MGDQLDHRPNQAEALNSERHAAIKNGINNRKKKRERMQIEKA